MPTKKNAVKKSQHPYVILRCKGAGVHAGNLVSRTGTEATMINSRRLWRWWSRFTLSELAMEGPSRPSECKFACVIPHEIILRDVCEVIPCTSAGEDGINAVQDANR